VECKDVVGVGASPSTRGRGLKHLRRLQAASGSVIALHARARIETGDWHGIYEAQTIALHARARIETHLIDHVRRSGLSPSTRGRGLKPWPRLFHNLWASCETDLASEFPIATVCKWIGNTVAIAAKHYVEPLDEHFQRAAGLAPLAAPQTPEISWNDEKPNRENPVFFAFCAVSPPSANTPMGSTGFESVSGSDKLSAIYDNRHKSLAPPAAPLATKSAPKVSDLAELIRSLPLEAREELRRLLSE